MGVWLKTPEEHISDILVEYSRHETVGRGTVHSAARKLRKAIRQLKSRARVKGSTPALTAAIAELKNARDLMLIAVPTNPFNPDLAIQARDHLVHAAELLETPNP